MAKNVVFPYVMFTQFVDEPNLKRLSLFFDSIYVDELRLQNILTISPNKKFEILNYERATWEFLMKKNIVKTYPFQMGGSSEDLESKELMNILGTLIPNRNSQGDQKEDPEQKKVTALENFFFAHDISARLDAIKLNQQSSSEFYPIFRTTKLIGQNSREEKKDNIIQFLLNDIPEPATDTPWEQIIDFRADEDVRNKYLAMINWVNKVAASSSNLNDIHEEYEYLYNDYIKHFKLHKLKYNNTLLEVIVTAGMGMLLALQAGQFVFAFKNLVEMKLSHINLIEQESKLPGKEVAYMYHVKERFGSK